MWRGNTFLLLIHAINELHALVNTLIGNLWITGIPIWSFHSQLSLSVKDLMLYLWYTDAFFISVYIQVYITDGNFSSMFRIVLH